MEIDVVGQPAVLGQDGFGERWWRRPPGFLLTVLCGAARREDPDRILAAPLRGRHSREPGFLRRAEVHAGTPGAGRVAEVIGFLQL